MSPPSSPVPRGGVAQGEESVRRGMDRLRAYWDRLGLSGVDRVYAEYQARRYPHLLRFWVQHPARAAGRRLDLGGGLGGAAVALSGCLGGEFDLAEYQRLEESRRPIAREYGIRETFACDLTSEDPFAGLPGVYDLILFIEVLEHLLVNPRYLARRISEKLARPGYLFVTTPNLVRLSSRLRMLRGRSFRDPDSFSVAAHGPFGHVAEYSLADLTELFGLEGYTLDSAVVVQNPPTPDGIGVRSESRRASRRLAYRWLDGPTARRFQLGDEIQALFRVG